MLNVFLKKGRVIDPRSGVDDEMDILIRDGVIEDVGRSLKVSKAIDTADLRGKIVAPGFLDMHVHLREPGFEHKETIETGCLAAAAGGFTAVCCMPNTNPPLDNESVVRYVKRRGSVVAEGIVDVYPIAAVTKGREGKELAPMAELVAAGAVAFSDDGSPVENAEVMRRALEYSSMFNVPIIQHAEDSSLTRGGAMNEGFVSSSLGLPVIPSVAEELMVSRDLALLEYVGGSYHVAHISTAGAVEIVRAAKKKGLSVSCEVTPHHFTLTEEAVHGYNTNTKMNPPLRTQEDVEAIKNGLEDGTIDAIASDHAPHSFDEKEVEFVNAPFGIVGLETTVGIAVTELLKDNVLDWKDLISKFSVNPRRILHLPSLKIEKGEKANLTVIDPNADWVVDPDRFKSKSKNTPFGGRRLKGRAIGVINNGVIKMS